MATQLALQFARGSARGAGGFPAGSPLAGAASRATRPVQSTQQSLPFGPPMSLGGRGLKGTNPAVQAKLAGMSHHRDTPVGGPLSSSWLPGNARPQPKPFAPRHSTLGAKVQMMDESSRLAGNGGIVAPGYNPGFQNPSERGFASVADFYQHRGTPSQQARFTNPPSRSPSNKAVNPSAADTAAAPPINSNAAAQTQEQFGTAMGTMGVGSIVGAGLGMGLIGGTTSYAFGGEFGQGFAVGATAGFGARGLKRAAMNNMAPGGGFTRKFGNEGGASGVAASALNWSGKSLQTMKSSTAMMAGAGLGGAMFGGDRNSHRRGFNQSRGNRF